jgi:hypothetical protein
LQKDDPQNPHEEELENKLLVKEKKSTNTEEVLQKDHMLNHKHQNVDFFWKKSVKEKNGNDEHETRPNIKPLKNMKTKTKSYFWKKNNQNQIGTKSHFCKIKIQIELILIPKKPLGMKIKGSS